MKAQWKRGSKFGGSAQTVYNEIERIRAKNNGMALPIHLVDAGKRENNPLHKHIWKETEKEAAHERRLYIARTVLRSIEVVFDEMPDKSIRAYEVVTQPAKHGTPERKVYTSTKEALSDPDMRDEILARAIREALSFKRRYHDLQELAQVFDALDKFLITHKAL